MKSAAAATPTNKRTTLRSSLVSSRKRMIDTPSITTPAKTAKIVMNNQM